MAAGGKARKAPSDEGSNAEREQLGQQLAALTHTYFHANIFNGVVDASQATFGSSGLLSQDKTSRRARTGRLTDEETRAQYEHFAEPPPFPAAFESLKRDHVVMLTGTGGLGKRAGAVQLLMNAGAGPIEVVSPTLTLQKLSEQEFESGHGYLVEDWQEAPRTSEASDFNWRALRDHVKDSKAHLVITAISGRAERSVRQFAWEAPPAVRVLAAHMADKDPDGETASRIAALIPDTYPDGYGVGMVASIAQRLAANADDEQKILDELSSDRGRYVREWLSADERTDHEIQAITALSFAAGQSDRLFEVMVKRLENSLREAGLVPTAEDVTQAKKEADDAARGGFIPRPSGLRGARTRARQDGLLMRELGTVRFQGEESHHQYLYHRYTLQELWREYDMTFWIAVRQWLEGLIGDTTILDVQVSVAVGLTLLAFTALDEVEDSYLHPWASGERAWPGQATAVYVLWRMSQDDSLAPIALRIATNWVNTGDSACQWTAAAALSGDLGAVYPAESAARIWHLVLQWKDVPTKAVMALASLFATLARERDGQDACQVLELLQERMNRTSRDRGSGPLPSWRDDRRNRERAMLCILEVLAVRDPRTKQPSITSFLVTWPEHRELVARLWAIVLRNRPSRRRALEAMLNAVRGFEYACDDPEAAARALGDALTEALPADEHQPLKRDFTNILARSKRPEGDTAAIVQALLDVLERLRPTERTAK
jgi:hypothetical protein